MISYRNMWFKVMLTAWLGIIPMAHAQQTTARPKVMTALGIRALPTVEMWGFIPASPSLAIAADLQRFRMRSDFSLLCPLDGIHFSLGFGYIFYPTGKNAPVEGGFQLKFPITGEIGLMFAKPEAKDGYEDVLNWFLIGPGAGIDFIWWKARKAGFVISFKGSWQFGIDMNSEYAGDYSLNDDKIGVLDIALLLGFVI